MAGTEGLFRVHVDDLEAGTEGVFHRAAGAAVLTVEHGDEAGGVVHHVAVAALHTAGAVAVLDHCFKVAAVHDGVPACLLVRRPAAALAGAGDGGLQRQVRVLGTQGQDDLGAVGVHAAGHAADEVAEAVVTGGADRPAQALLQLGAAGIAFVIAPGELLRTVAGKAYGHLPCGHGSHRLSYGIL